MSGSPVAPPVPPPPVEQFEAETGQEVPPDDDSSGSGPTIEEEVGVAMTRDSMDGGELSSPEVPTSSELSHDEPIVAESENENKVSEVTTGQSVTPQLQATPSLPPPDLELLTPSQTSLTELTSMNSSQPNYQTTFSSTTQSNTSETSYSDGVSSETEGDVVDDTPIKTSSPVEISQDAPGSLPLPSPASSQPSERPPLLHHLSLQGAEPLSSSLQSLPSSFSPKGPPNNQSSISFLGYNPLMVGG